MNDEVQAGDERAGDNPMARGVVLTGLLVAGSLYYLNRRWRGRDGSGVDGSAVVEEVQPAMSQGGELVHRGQQFLENTLDRLSEQAMAEVKVILKNGLHHLEQMVDDL